MTRYLHRGLLASLASLTLAAPAIAQERFKPAPSDRLIASVHAQAGRDGSLRTLDQAWRADPKNLDAALAFARAVFVLGLRQGDLRWFGSARAALAPWWQASELPAQAYFLRGLVKQGFHDFEGGLRDIKQAIEKDRAQAEFWSWRFALHLLLADMNAARQDCEEIARLFGQEEADIYRAVLLYRTGQATQAIAKLQRAMDAPRFKDPGSQDWIGFHLGEAYRVAGQTPMALATWDRQLKAQPQSHLIRLSLVELLNQSGRHAEAKKLIALDTATDALLMQAVIASRGLKDGDEARLAQLLDLRLQSQAQRGESLIERPKLIYLIAYGKDPAAGLALSIDNWKLQKEPPDALLFVQAALATHQPRAAEPVIAWAQQTGYTDADLAPLIERLKSHPKWNGGSR
jgi:tetratricopeptide (TPR) repeat protein